MYVAFQLVSRSDSATQCSMRYDHLDLERLYCRVNNTQFPLEQYDQKWNDANGGKLNISRAYYEYIRSNNKQQDGDSGLAVSLRDYANLYPIYYIDLSKSTSENEAVFDTELDYDKKMDIIIDNVSLVEKNCTSNGKFKDEIWKRLKKNQEHFLDLKNYYNYWWSQYEFHCR